LAPEDINKAICIDNTNVKVKLAFPGALLWFLGKYFDPRLMISFQLREVLIADRGKMLETIGVVTLVIHINMQFYLEKVGFWLDENFMGSIFSLSHFFKNRKVDRLQDAIVSILPAFKSCISELTDDKKEDLLENPWSHNLNHND
jgi:hypothetical protein